MRRTAFALALLASGSAAAVSSVDAAELGSEAAVDVASRLSKVDEIRLKTAIAECLAYVSMKDPQGFAELYRDRSSKERTLLRFAFNGCIASRGPALIWR